MIKTKSTTIKMIHIYKENYALRSETFSCFLKLLTLHIFAKRFCLIGLLYSLNILKLDLNFTKLLVREQFTCNGSQN